MAIPYKKILLLIIYTISIPCYVFAQKEQEKQNITVYNHPITDNEVKRMDSLISDFGVVYEEKELHRQSVALCCYDLNTKAGEYICVGGGPQNNTSGQQQFVYHPSDIKLECFKGVLFFIRGNKPIDWQKISPNDIQEFNKILEKEPHILVDYYIANSQKSLLTEIFRSHLNSTMSYRHYFDELKNIQLGDICFAHPSPIIFPNRKRERILVIYKDNVAFDINVMRKDTRIMKAISEEIPPNYEQEIDVTDVAKYVIMTYEKLNEDLLSDLVFREWIILSEKTTLKAKYLDSKNEKVQLKKEDGSTLMVELSKLSPQDRIYVQRRVEIADAEEKQLKNVKKK
jgi:hypothetical protein